MPTVCVAYLHEILYNPRAILVTKYTNLVHFKHHLEGGHFPALQLPKVFAEDVYDGFAKILASTAPSAWRTKIRQKSGKVYIMWNCSDWNKSLAQIFFYFETKRKNWSFSFLGAVTYMFLVNNYTSKPNDLLNLLMNSFSPLLNFASFRQPYMGTNTKCPSIWFNVCGC